MSDESCTINTFQNGSTMNTRSPFLPMVSLNSQQMGACLRRLSPIDDSQIDSDSNIDSL